MGYFTGDLLWVIGAFISGFIAGIIFKSKPDKPLSYIETKNQKRHEFKPPVAIAEHGRREQWVTMTRRLICLYEILERENARRGRRVGWLPSKGDLEQATGQTWRTFKPYWEPLEAGGVVVIVESAGMKWLMNYHARRAVVESLPYDLTRTPPKFTFMRTGVLARSGRSGRSGVTEGKPNAG